MICETGLRRLSNGQTPMEAVVHMLSDEKEIT